MIDTVICKKLAYFKNEICQANRMLYIQDISNMKVIAKQQEIVNQLI